MTFTRSIHSIFAKTIAVEIHGARESWSSSLEAAGILAEGQLPCKLTELVRSASWPNLLAECGLCILL